MQISSKTFTTSNGHMEHVQMYLQQLTDSSLSTSVIAESEYAALVVLHFKRTLKKLHNTVASALVHAGGWPIQLLYPLQNPASCSISTNQHPRLSRILRGLWCDVRKVGGEQLEVDFILVSTIKHSIQFSINKTKQEKNKNKTKQKQKNQSMQDS